MSKISTKESSIFVKNRQVEFCIKLGVFSGLLIWIGSLFKANLLIVSIGCISLSLGLFCLFVCLSRMLSFLLASFQGQARLIDNCFMEEVIFNGDIKELTLALYNTEFVLKKKIGDFYIFRENYHLFSKGELVVIIGDNHCFLQSSKVLIKLLEKQIAFNRLPKKRLINIIRII
jgi:hypothetical protein